MKSLVVALMLFIPTFASATLITGSSVIFQANPSVFGPVTATIGAGADVTSEYFLFDFNAGSGGDVFSWISSPGAGNLAGSTSVALSDMSFVGGDTLTGFTLFSTVLSDLTWSTTTDSITFSYTSTGLVGSGSILQGQYAVLEHAVSEPGMLVMFALGLLGLAVFSRKKSSVE